MNYQYNLKKENFNIFKYILKPFVLIYYRNNSFLYRAITRLILGFILSFILYGILILFIRFDRIKSYTMQGTFSPGDLIITSKLKYGIEIKPFVSSLTGKTIVFSKPKRGDIVFLVDPRTKEDGYFKRFLSYIIYYITFGNVNISNTRYLIKRVVGLPNETIEIKNKVVYINGIALNEPWANIERDNIVLDSKVSRRDNIEPYIIGFNEYFVLSDNRDYGYDSRDFGSIHFSNINGKVISK